MPNNNMTSWKILAFITNYHNAKGVAPTMREIGDAVGLASTSTVHKYIRTMIDAGLLTAANSKPRSIVPVCNVHRDNGEEAPPAHRIRVDMSDGGSLYFDYQGEQPLGNIPQNICGVFDGTQLKQPVCEIASVHVVLPDE